LTGERKLINSVAWSWPAGKKTVRAQLLNNPELFTTDYTDGTDKREKSMIID
jgi:hypothetical protein